MEVERPCLGSGDWTGIVAIAGRDMPRMLAVVHRIEAGVDQEVDLVVRQNYLGDLKGSEEAQRPEAVGFGFRSEI